MASWKDYAPSIGTGAGAIGLGALLAAVGDKRKRIRNAILGALLGGVAGHAIGDLSQSNSDLHNAMDKAKTHAEKLKLLRDRYRGIADTYDAAARKIGLKGNPLPSLETSWHRAEEESMNDQMYRAEALKRIAEELGTYQFAKTLSPEGADLAYRSIGIPEDAETFKAYHDTAEDLGPNGKYVFLPIPKEDLRTTARPAKLGPSSGSGSGNGSAGIRRRW